MGKILADRECNDSQMALEHGIVCVRTDSEMSPRFGVTHQGSMVAKSVQVMSKLASCAQQGAALTESFNFSNTPPLPCHILELFHFILTAFRYLYSNYKR